MSSLIPFSSTRLHPVTQPHVLPRFETLLPASAETVGSPPTILLAEDDDDILELTRAFLKTSGYSVLSCTNGRIAAEVFRKAPHIDLLVTDLRMPEISGLELARDLTSLDASLPVLMISGEVPTQALEDEIARRGWKFLGKPWRFPGLLATIHSMLGDPPMEQAEDSYR